jgi:hypothetical protein
MTIFLENDVISLLDSVSAEVIGEDRSLVVPAGAIGSIVNVHKDASLRLLACEVEFYIEDQNCYALATVEVNRMLPQ